MQVAKAKLLSILILIPSPVYAELPWQPIELEDYLTTRPETVELGRKLFDDEILSGNRNISCQTCHHPDFGTADGLSLGLGEGAMGVGNERKANEDIRKRVPATRLICLILGTSLSLNSFGMGVFLLIHRHPQDMTAQQKPGYRMG